MAIFYFSITIGILDIIFLLFMIYSFIALDLETTWLNHECDSIMEIAMVQFTVEKNEKWLHMEIWESFSYLINPNKEIPENIQIITGITEEMVIWAPLIHTLQEDIYKFIGNNIIVWHNVLFDTGMLQSHDIDISGNTVVDTFELSEILFQEAESLNLAFLSDKFWIKTWNEHRALDDVIMSIQLFWKIIQEIQWLSDQKKNMFSYFENKDTSWMFWIICDILNISNPTITHTEIIPEKYLKKEYDNTMPCSILRNGQENNIKLLSLWNNFQEEIDYIHQIFVSKWASILLYKNTSSIDEVNKELKKRGVNSYIYHPIDSFLSLHRFFYILSKWIQFKRKVWILYLKILIWLQDTKQGNLDELKFYGDEYNESLPLRCNQYDIDEYFINHQIDSCNKADTIVWSQKECFEITSAIKKTHHRNLIIGDIGFMESSIREALSIHIQFNEIEKFLMIEMRWDESEEQLKEKIFFHLSIIKEYIIRTAIKNTEENRQSKNEYANNVETYLLSQEMIWKEGRETLILSANSLYNSWSQFIKILNKEIFIEYNSSIYSIQTYIQTLCTFICRRNENISTILRKDWDTISLNIIKRNISDDFYSLVHDTQYENIFLYWIYIHTPIISKFIQDQLNCMNEIHHIQNKNHNTPVIHFLAWERNINGIIQKNHGIWGVAIIAPNMKEARALHSYFKKSLAQYTILSQWLSGGKSKIFSNFYKNPNNSIIIGNLSFFLQETTFWESIRSVIIIKIPFESPNDPYFLGKTYEMHNSFLEYNFPVTLHKMNFLINNITKYHFSLPIWIMDEKISLTEWGWKFKNEITN